MASIKTNHPVRMNASMAFVLLLQHLLVMRHPCCTGGCGGCSCLCGMVVPWWMLQGDVQCQQQDSIYMADHSRTFDQVSCQWAVIFQCIDAGSELGSTGAATLLGQHDSGEYYQHSLDTPAFSGADIMAQLGIFSCGSSLSFDRSCRFCDGFYSGDF